MGQVPACPHALFLDRVIAGSRLNLGGPLSPFFFSAQRSLFRRGRDPRRTQFRDPADELHRNRLSEEELDRPLSQLIAPEFIFERREERSRCGEKRIVSLKAGIHPAQITTTRSLKCSQRHRQLPSAALDQS